jgi:hypothetical protein
VSPRILLNPQFYLSHHWHYHFYSPNNCIPKLSTYGRVSAVAEWIDGMICATTNDMDNYPCMCFEEGPNNLCAENQLVTITVQHDNFPAETAWSLYRIDGTWIEQQIQGNVTTPMQLVQKTVSLDEGI